MFKEVQTTKILNLASKMDNRSNNEIMDLDANNTGFLFTQLENADLYHYKSTQTRGGVVDLCNGVVNIDFPSSQLLNFTGNTGYYHQGTSETFDFGGLIYIPTGNTALVSGTLMVNEILTPASYTGLGAQAGYDLGLKVHVFKLDQANYPPSGISWMAQTVAGQLHDIGLSGDYNVPAYPQIADLTPVGIGYGLFNLGSHFVSGGNYVTADSGVNFTFKAPVELLSGSVYWLRYDFELTSGTSTRGTGFRYVTNASTDLAPNARLGQEFLYIGPPANQFNAVRLTLGGDKSYPVGSLYTYAKPAFIDIDYPTANSDYFAPLVSGTTFNGSLSSTMVTVPTPFPFNGATTDPPISTTTVEFGQVFPLSGTGIYYGSYHWASPWESTGWTAYKRDHTSITGNGYNLGYVALLSKVNESSGTTSSGNYQVLDRTILASYSGNYVFDDQNDNQSSYNSASSPDFRLHKIYGIFDNPVAIAATGEDYLLSFKYVDATTGTAYTDYSYRNITTGFFAPSTQYASYIKIGKEKQGVYPTGAFVTNYNNDGQTFIMPSGDDISMPTGVSLTCGLISIPSGNAIVGVYDYRRGENRTQRVVYGQGPYLKDFQLNNPDKSAHQTIWNAAATGNNFKWTFATYQDLMFAHQYSQSSGVVWDQIHASGQYHGKRPTFSLSQLSGTSGGLASGTSVSVLLATQHSSGGYRASEPISITTSGNGYYIKLTGTEIASQYGFDIPAASTSAFVTQNGGSTYYLAELLTGTFATAGLANNPLPNSGTFGAVYIGDVDASTLTSQVDDVLVYDQAFLTEQVNTPKFKQLAVFNDYLLGIGDPDYPSRIWYSAQFSPQCFGTDGQFAGYIDVDVNNGSPITSIQAFKQFLLIFKKNSTYRMQYTGDPTAPFGYIPISKNIGSLGVFGTVTTDYGVFGLSQYGVFQATTAGVETVSDVIQPYLNDLDRTDMTFAVAIHDRERQQIHWSISSLNTSASRNIGITYNYVEGGWSVRRGGMWNAGAIVGDTDNFDLIIIGNVLGQIQQANVGETDTDTLFMDGNDVTLTKSITLRGDTPWMTFANTVSRKCLRMLHMNADRSQGQLQVDVYFDNAVTPAYTRYIDLDTDNPDKRVNLGESGRSWMMVLTSVGQQKVKLNSIYIEYQDLGRRQP